MIVQQHKSKQLNKDISGFSYLHFEGISKQVPGRGGQVPIIMLALIYAMCNKIKNFKTTAIGQTQMGNKQPGANILMSSTG